MSEIKTKHVASQILGNRGSIGEAMREAGYSDAYSKNPKQFQNTKEYKDLVDPLINQLDEEIQSAMDEAKKKRGKAGYSDCINSVEKLSKLRQLLSGKATSREENHINIDATGLSGEELNEHLKKLIRGKND